MSEARHQAQDGDGGVEIQAGCESRWLPAGQDSGRDVQDVSIGVGEVGASLVGSSPSRTPTD